MLEAVGEFFSAYGWPLVIAGCVLAYLYQRYLGPAAAAAGRRARDARAKRAADTEEFATQQGRMAEARERQLRKLQLEAEARAAEAAAAAPAAAAASAAASYIPGEPGQTRRSLLKYTDPAEEKRQQEAQQQQQQRRKGPGSGRRLRDDYNPLVGDQSTTSGRYRPSCTDASSSGGG